MQGDTHKLFDLTGKVAVVTGGGGGLGREFCDVLAEYGADITCPDLLKDKAEETCENIKKYGHKTLPLEVDISSYESVQKMFGQIMSVFGRIDILVNNAGISTGSRPIGEVELEEWHAIINTNLNGTFYCLREGLNIMKEQQSGVIVNIASVLGLRVTEPAMLSVPPYVASKFGIVGLTLEAASEYARYGIRVNGIAPGFHHGTGIGGRSGIAPETPPPDMPPPAGGSPITLERTPMHRTGEPGELKALLLYLVADSSSFMTGQVIANDGGLSIW
ncbi:MAG: SDR family NAD(P)-dependent oxidoreductase [Dehalococcoidales bacterium]|nr:SDR family NAD(P)-dependent oxidoreductase [Dehalococcoidales bacterium]